MLKGWKLVPLGEVCSFKNGGSLGYTKSDYKFEGYPAYSASGQDGYVDDVEHKGNAVILSSIGARCGKTFLATGEWTSLANTQLMFPNEEKVDVRYLWYFTNDERRWPRSGSAQPFIKPRDGKAILIPLPPIAVQRAIVGRIEQLFDEIDDGKANLGRAREGVGTYRNSLLKAAMSGELSAGWRATHAPKASGDDLLRHILAERRSAWEADPDNKRKRYREPAGPALVGFPEVPAGWAIASIEQVISGALIGLDRGRSQQTIDPRQGVGYIKMNNITMGGAVDLSKLVYVRASRPETEKFAVRKGDLLFNTRNSVELVGKTGIIDDAVEPMVFNNNLMRLRTGRAILPDFLAEQMQSLAFRRQLERIKRATTSVAAIYAGSLMSCWVAVPPLAEQEIILNHIRNVGAPNLDADTEGQAETLRQSILAAAFRGELIQ